MGLIDRLYEQSIKDGLDIQIDSYRKSLTQATNVATIYANYLIPADRVLILQSVVWKLTPGAAQSVWGVQVQTGGFQDPGGLPLAPSTLFATSDPRVQSIAGYPAATDYYFSQEFDDLIIPGSRAIVAIGMFSAGVALNTLVTHINGYTIPRGNIGL